MSEGNHVVETNAGETTAAAQPRSRVMIYVGGTAALILVAGIGMQMFRSWKHADAAPPTGAGAAVPSPTIPKDFAAKITFGQRSIQITYEMLAEECMKRNGDEVLDSIINRAVIQLACENAGVTVTQVDVEQEIIRIARSFNIPVETWLNMLTTERGITPQQYQRDVIWPMLALKKLAGSDVEITEKDMHQAFVHNYGARVKARMIMVENPRQANQIAEEARTSPESFARLAMKHSIEPGSRGLGGSVPPIARYSGNPTIENVAFRMKPGEISEIIQVGTTWVILKCEGFTEPVVTDIEEVRERLFNDLVETKVQEEVAKLFEKLKKDSRIDNYWKGTTTGNIQQVSGQTVTPGGQPRSAIGTAPRPAQTTSPRTTSPTGTRPR